MMAIDPNGNVGIGTDNPNVKLHITGSNANNSIMKLVNTTAGTTSNDYMYIKRNDDGKSYILNVSAHDLILGANNSSSQLVLSSDGNVGIGTTNPGEKLYISGNLHIQKSSPSTTSDSNEKSQMILSHAFGGGKESGGIQFITDDTSTGAQSHTRLKINTYSGGNLNAYNLNTFTIKTISSTAANVGIGTPDPGKKLSVAGDIMSQVGTGGIILTGENTGGAIWANDNYDENNSGNGWSRIMTFKKNGFIGVGTDSPTEMLDVNGNLKCSTLVTSGDFISDSKIGIGTTSPSAPLEVFAGSGSTNLNAVIINNNFTGGDDVGTAIQWKYHWIDDGGHNGPAIRGVVDGVTTGQGFHHKLFFETNGSKRMAIDYNGNVGFGTTNPTEKLHVENGNVLVNKHLAEITLASPHSMIYGVSTGTLPEFPLSLKFQKILIVNTVVIIKV